MTAAILKTGERWKAILFLAVPEFHFRRQPPHRFPQEPELAVFPSQQGTRPIPVAAALPLQFLGLPARLRRYRPLVIAPPDRSLGVARGLKLAAVRKIV